MSWECACGITNNDNVTNYGGCAWTRERSKEYLENNAKGITTTVQGSSSKAVPYGILGFLLGCVIGFLLRPSVFLVGQLPFFVVLTHGAGLKGADAMFIPAAQTSFNYMFVAGILGAILGGFVGNSLGKKSVAMGGAVPRHKFANQHLSPRRKSIAAIAGWNCHERACSVLNAGKNKRHKSRMGF